MGIILDIIIIAIIVITAILSAKHGFVRTAVELAGFCLSIYLAFTLSTPAAAFIYNSWVEPSVVSGIEKSIVGAGSGMQAAAVDALPDFIANNLEKFGLSEAELTSSISDNVAITAQNLCDNVIEPILTGIFRTVLAIILFIALTFVVRLLAKLLNKLFSFSLVGTLNKTLGFGLGAFKGAVFAAIFCALVVLITSFAGSGFLIFSADAVKASVICNWFTSFAGINIFSF